MLGGRLHVKFLLRHAGGASTDVLPQLVCDYFGSL
jgi:hypothetical protein